MPLFTSSDKTLLNNFLVSHTNGIDGSMSMQDFWDLITEKEKIVINKILTLNPYSYGFRGKDLENVAVPQNLIRISEDANGRHGEAALSKVQYLPTPVFDSFNLMNTDFQTQYPGRKLLVESGYRSPAFQVVVLIYILAKIYNFDISATLKRVALPRYSQHCSATNTAVDIRNIDGLPTDENPQEFKNTAEYEWLSKNAAKYNFYESYPLNNDEGVMWEPWHWQYKQPI